MKSKILFSIFGMILLLGATYAAGVTLSSREASITDDQKITLATKGISDFIVTQLECKDNYCTFWITKKDVINSQRRIEMYRQVCVESKVGIEPEECENEGGSLNEKKECIKTICSQVLKTDIELVNERNSIVDSLIGSLADNIKVEGTKAPQIVKGTDEKITITAKAVIDER
jgi:hypothetical protein